DLKSFAIYNFAMPFIIITTNVPKEKIPDDFIGSFVKEIARIMEKPLTTITVILHAGVYMFRLGCPEPAASLVIRDVRKFDNKETNRNITDKIMKELLQHLDIVPQRVSAMLVAEDANTVGLAGGKLLSDVLKI
ncbi:phenylpyruvate tautomerase MIF-related protein, partial [Salmonella sp. s55004]|uniref:phenylpyruvate tautomerase MIF-related protein n=1 Tax=Salmonella sp. s55004 TaxID=3159675 RepID=UPI00397F7D4C